MIDQNIEAFLKLHDIPFQPFYHPAVFTCADVEKIEVKIPGVNNKNLFLSDEKRERYFLITVEASKKVALKKVAKYLSVKDLRFGSPEELKHLLGIEPGSVSLLALMNDTQSKVEVIIDQIVWEGEVIQCHPLINTATFTLLPESMKKFLEATSHKQFLITEIPAKS